MHVIKCTEENVNLWRNSASVQLTPDTDVVLNSCIADVVQPLQNKLVQTDCEIGDWVVVRYDDDENAGEVTEVFSKEIVVSVMHCAGNFKWPDREAESVYPLEAVVSRINLPVVATH